MIRVAIADDHALVRQGLRLMLDQAEDMTVVGEAEDGIEAVELCEQVSPDVLVIDVSMPRMNGIHAIAEICGHGNKRNHTRALVISMYDDAALVRRALQAGANGFILKRADTAELMHALRAVAQGNTYLSPEVSQVLVDMVVSGGLEAIQDSPIERLTRRESEILKLVAEGYTSYEIAAMINITVKTVQKHRANLMHKLDIHDVAGLTLAAIKYGLLQLDR